MQKLIDANALEKEVEESLHGNPHTGIMENAMHTHEHKHFLCIIDRQPTINPEDLTIVRQLREELARVTAERDAAVRDMHQNTKCFVCANLPADGNMAHCKYYAACGLSYTNWKWRGQKRRTEA